MGDEAGELVRARWVAEHVLALARTPANAAAAEGIATPSRWAGLGCDDAAVWGRCRGTGAEAYDVAVHHAGAHVAARCSCPARVAPCKHALALLLLWVRGAVPAAEAPGGVRRWVATRPTTGSVDDGRTDQRAAADLRSVHADAAAAPRPPTVPTGDRRRDDRAERVFAGLCELDRWIADRLRTGLADPELARYATWDALAARLVDAQAQGLANRVRRLGGTVGTRADWHDQLLAELGMLRLLAHAGRRLRDLPPDLADGVAAAVGWQVRQADVLAGVPETDRWLVAGRSDVREDRIVVRRVWLWGRSTRRWAMTLSFAAYGQQLDERFVPGDEVHADLHRYPGALRLRAIVGRVHDHDHDHGVAAAARPEALSVADGCAAVGSAIALEPWLERHPVTFHAALERRRGGGWSIADHTGWVPVAAGAPGIATSLACTAHGPCALTAEWTASGFVPVTLHLDDRTVDVGPVHREEAA